MPAPRSCAAPPHPSESSELSQCSSCSVAAVAILVDDPLWHWRGRRWCHLVSDISLDELHAFAAQLGIPARVFQGDHYDVPEEHRFAAVASGAEPVSSRELLRRLRAAGLRLTPAQRRRVVISTEPEASGSARPS